MADGRESRSESDRPDSAGSRRKFLKLAGVTVTSGLAVAGCSERRRNDGPGPDPSQTPTPGATPTDSPTDTEEPTDSPTDTEEPTEEQTEPPAYGTDFIYNSAAEMAAIKRKVTAGEEPWLTGYRFLQRGADEAMRMRPRSVEDKRSSGYPPHRFVANVNGRDDYGALKEMGDAVLDLGLMYYFTGADKYAERAIDFIHHWCLAPKTYMAPNGDALNVGPELRIHILAPKLWWGASFLRGHPYWTEIDATMPWTGETASDGETAFRAWVRALMESTPAAGYAMQDNHWAWRIAFYSSTAAYLGEDELLERTFGVWKGETKVPKGHTILTLAEGSEFYPDKNRPWDDYEKYADGSGFMSSELGREKAYFYTVFNLEAMSLTAEIARTRGVDLYSFNAPTDPDDGSTMKKLFSFMDEYCVDPSKWKWGNGSAGVRSGDWQRCKTVFELAHSEWNTDAFRRAVTDGDLKRPFSSYYIMRHPTLTHANRFELNV
jgi:hypothetical protein